MSVTLTEEWMREFILKYFLSVMERWVVREYGVQTARVNRDQKIFIFLSPGGRTWMSQQVLWRPPLNEKAMYICIPLRGILVTLRFTLRCLFIRLLNTKSSYQILLNGGTEHSFLKPCLHQRGGARTSKFTIAWKWKLASAITNQVICWRYFVAWITLETEMIDERN